MAKNKMRKSDFTPIRNSIVTHVLKAILAIYLVIVLTLTTIHLIAEYRYTKNNVIKELAGLEMTIRPALAQAIWDVNLSQTKSILNGLIKLPIIVGVKVNDHKNNMINQIGNIINKDGKEVTAQIDGKFTENQQTNNLFWHKIPIIFKQDNNNFKLGEVTIYSDSSIVYDRIKISFLLLLINMLIQIIVFSSLFIWITGSKLRRPLAELANSTQFLQLDKLETAKISIHTNKNNELKKLEIAFNTMITNLLTARQDLQKIHLEHKHKLEEKVAQRTKELKDSQEKAISNARKAGMAEIATGAIHNIGNVLNNINMSTEMIKKFVNSAFVNKFANANKLLSANLNNLENFILRDPKGKKLLEYYIELGKLYGQENTTAKNHLSRLREKIDRCIAVIASQQEYAVSATIMMETLNLKTLVIDVIKLEKGSIEKADITITTDLQDAEVNIDKSKVFNIIINLFNNAKDSMREISPEKRFLSFASLTKDNRISLKVTDSGIGINKENLDKIFTHGFTTKKDGHGFGLHSCANYMGEMKGSISVESDGPGKGASFILTFQLNKKKEKNYTFIFQSDK